MVVTLVMAVMAVMETTNEPPACLLRKKATGESKMNPALGLRRSYGGVSGGHSYMRGGLLRCTGSMCRC